MDLTADLSKNSKIILDQYLRWGKMETARDLRDIEYESHTYRENHLIGNTFNRHDVEVLLKGQMGILTATMERRDQAKQMATAELCRAILRNADKHSVPITVCATDVLSDRNAHSAMEGHDKRLLEGPKGKLAPLSAIDHGDVGKRLIEANEEIQRLHAKIFALSSQLHDIMGGQSEMNAKLLNTKDALLTEQQRAERKMKQDAEAAVAAAKVTPPSTIVTNTVSVVDEKALDALRKEVATLNKDMAAKLNQSTQFMNLKKMLSEKNAQVKVMRSQLARFDPTYAASIGDDISEEED
eukprot:Tbor_TRINITY_DN5523_c1_g1::TRINITY_DN5523_c1_g1_i1::g.12804::m.12804/K19400/LZTFL1; leucine zipper transcription factor-like protein 1